MPSIQHLLETRFSVRFSSAAADPAWLAERLELLRQICLPSVAAQTTQDFTWLLLCDEATDPEVLNELRVEERRLPALRIGLTAAERPPLSVVRSAVRDENDVLITTRLDSDDAICDRYIEAVQAYAESFHRSIHENLLVNFPRGYRLDLPQQRLYRDWMPNSSFHSLFERPQGAPPKGVMSAGHTNLRHRYRRYERLPMLDEKGAGWHARLHQHYPTHQDESVPAWLIAVHEGNVVNRIPSTARETALGELAHGFTLGEDVLRSPTARQGD